MTMPEKDGHEIIDIMWHSIIVSIEMHGISVLYYAQWGKQKLVVRHYILAQTYRKDLEPHPI